MEFSKSLRTPSTGASTDFLNQFHSLLKTEGNLPFIKC